MNKNRRTSLCAPPSINDPKYDSNSFRFFRSSKKMGEMEEQYVQSSRWPPQADVEYDWTIPTNVAYRQTDDHAAKNAVLFSPRFSEARSRLDYSYHKNPEMPRQIFQDAVLKRVLDSAPSADSNNTTTSFEMNSERDIASTAKQNPNVQPTIVFTAGPMGVGKSYVLTQLYQRDLFPLDDFVKIDPDMIKSEIPEFSGYQEYVRKNPGTTTAATQVHRESTQLSDILFEHALAHNLNILVDGSLRDVDWYQQLFMRVKEEFPQYRLLIVYVSASEDVIRSRAASRAKNTGREVPEDLLKKSIDQVPRSVNILKDITDATVEITNNDGEPLSLKQLHPASDKEESDWDVLADLWEGDKGKEQQREQPIRYSIISNMQDAFHDTEQHEMASKIWSSSYPAMCPRCAVSCDGQCGVCIHERHLCACEICKTPCRSGLQ